ncbi:unnamed protein product [Dicrocoelium dendriticum]|nr:unnamed protein product [Dicrocoelium dendriticum]
MQLGRQLSGESAASKAYALKHFPSTKLYDPEFESDRPKPTVGAPTRSSVVEPTRGYLEFAIPSERLPHKFDRSNGHAIPSAYSALHPSPSVPAGVIRLVCGFY